MDEKKKTDWVKYLTFVFCGALLFANYYLSRQINFLGHQISDTQTAVMDSIRNMESTAYSQLQEADKLVQDWSYTSAVNRERRGVDIQFSVVLKEWQADTAVKLVCGIENTPGSEKVVPLAGDGAGAFTGTVELMPSELSGEYTLDAVTTNGETQRRESLGYLSDFGGMLPVQGSGYSYYAGPEYTRGAGKNGTVTLSSCGIRLEGLKGDSLPDLSGQVFRLRRNGEIAAEKTAMLGDIIEEYTCGELSSEAQIGDDLTLTFFCRDNSGLGYEFFLSGWTIDEDGIANQAPETDWPKLTWD